MRIWDLTADDEKLVEEAAALLVAGFKEMAPDAWPEMDSALEEVREMLVPDRICRVAVDDAGQLLGWIGGIPEYDGNVWELHPLVVEPKRQGEGIGRALVADFEDQVRERGALTIFLGTDDVLNLTSLGGRELYPNPLEHLVRIQNLGRHPFEFYQKLGFVLVGVVPDANGIGKPDIYMAKQVEKKTAGV